MSYLVPPRLHFAGRFQADVSTANNDPRHYNSRTFQANFNVPGTNSQNGWWNPGGTGAWRLSGCTVQRVVYTDGTSAEDFQADPIIGAAVRNTESRVSGKIVDLDSEQQMVSEIWGFQVVIKGLTAAGSPFGFTSDFQVAAFADIWRRVPNGVQDSMFGAFYQSVLDVADWEDGGSRFLKELCAGGRTPPQLSIRFNVDGYDDSRESPAFTYGRITGSIGVYHPGEPKHFIAGRALNPPAPPVLKNAYAQVRDHTLHLDLGNSLPTTSPGGELIHQPALYAAILPAGGKPELLGKIRCDQPDWYSRTAGIVSFPLTPVQAQLAAGSPLAVVQLLDGEPAPQVLLSESPDGKFLRADRFVFRLNPGDTQVTRLYAAVFGATAPNLPVRLIHDSSMMVGKSGQIHVPGPPRVGVPEDALRFPGAVTTGAGGTVDVEIAAGNPGRPRDYIDGQVYGIGYALGTAAPAIGATRNASRMLNALVFSGYTPPEEPTWLEDVQPIFQQYDNLFPVMRAIVELSNYASVIGRLGILRKVFELPEADPNYMPVTRDMSRAKRAMIRRWLENPVYMRLDSVEDLIQALQLAIEVEHSTIPPYLCALYSIKDGTNVEVAGILREVVMQEMVHMARVANLLTALGAGPKMDDPAFVPRYPGPLPAGLRGGLAVRLRRCSIAQIRDVFMSMEEPEATVEPGSVIAFGGPVKPHQFTIGWFYDEIECALVNLHKLGAIKFGHVERQVKLWPGPPGAAGNCNLLVTNLEEARASLRTIKQEGESTLPLHPSQFGDELGHYYRFFEIVEGRRIVVDPAKKTFTFTGAHIPFDPNSVWPMIDDPDMASYPPGSRAQILARQFAESYRALLKGLHRTFNGHPEYLGEAIGLMYSLNLAARELMQTPSGRNDGTNAGPTFQLMADREI